MSDGIDLSALRNSFRDVLSDALPIDVLLKHGASGAAMHAALWEQITELGWPALAVAEAHCGLGLGFDALGVLYEELGRALAPLPLLPTMLVAEALARGGTADQQATWLTKIAVGEVIASLTPPGDAPRVTAQRDGDQLILSGVAQDMLDGAAASVLLIAVELEGRTHRMLVDGKAATHQPCFDLTRSLATLDLTGAKVPATALLEKDVEAALAEHAAIALACDAAAGAARILEITLDYLKTREQFGRVIGSFQALKHRMADHQTNIIAISALSREAVAMRARGEDVALEAPAAKAYACETYGGVTRDAIQLHGGIGVTWEHVCHLYLKRAKLNEALYGDSAAQLDTLFTRLAA